MDYRVARILRYAIYALVGLLCILLLVVAYNGIKNAFKASSTSESAPQAANLAELQSSGASVQYVVEGAINAPEEHREIIITISPTQRIVEVIEGYDVAPIQSQAYANSQESYDAFMSALNTAGFTLVQESLGISRTGSCPFGSKYSYQIVSFDTLAQDTWNNSCTPKKGTFAGNYSTVRKLFQTQIPDYSDVTTAPY